MGYSIFQKLSDHETVWVGSAQSRREAEQRVASLTRYFRKKFYAVDVGTGEILYNLEDPDPPAPPKHH